MHRDAAILLVDAQSSFIAQMHGPREPLLARLERLLMLAEMLDLPVIATVEHPVEEKGALPDRLETALPPAAQRFVKKTFDCLAEPPIRAAIESLHRRTIAVAGGETDVCILQSVLALVEAGYRVFLLEDCLFTSEANPAAAL